LISLYYFLSDINNKYINGIKADIRLYLQTSEVSSSFINTLANIRILIIKKTVNNQKIKILSKHK